MAINTTFYLDAADLVSAVSIYLDSNLINLAPDGFYGNGLITRQQSSGILLPAEDCATCGTPCGQIISTLGEMGIYLLNIDLGSDLSDVGAVIIRFDPFKVPEGIRVIYDSLVYNKLSSPEDGLHQSETPGNFTIIGNSSNTGSCSPFWYPDGATIDLNEYLYDGNIFNNTGNSQQVTIDINDISLGFTPGNSVMVIPKLNATPNVINIELIGPCTEVFWDIQVECPALLPSFSSSQVSANDNVSCEAPFFNTFYFAKVHIDVDTWVGLYDYVFSDAYGEFKLADGYYLTDNVASPNKVLKVENGIVTQITNCF